MPHLLVRFIFIAVIACFSSVSFALEYLSDSELERLDGYTSDTLVEEYDDEGNLSFKRLDNYQCRFEQDDQSGDARLKCENQFETEQDRLLAENFERFLQSALPFFEENPEFDTPGDGIQSTTLTGLLQDFDYNHLLCDGHPERGVIRFEGLTIENEEGEALQIGPIISRIEEREVNGRLRRVIVSETPEIRGRIGFSALKIGTSVEGAQRSPSLGGIYATQVGPSSARIYLRED